MVERISHIRVIRTQHLLSYRLCPQIAWLSFIILALRQTMLCLGEGSDQAIGCKEPQTLPRTTTIRPVFLASHLSLKQCRLVVQPTSKFGVARAQRFFSYLESSKVQRVRLGVLSLEHERKRKWGTTDYTTSVLRGNETRAPNNHARFFSIAAT